MQPDPGAGRLEQVQVVPRHVGLLRLQQPDRQGPGRRVADGELVSTTSSPAPRRRCDITAPVPRTRRAADQLRSAGSAWAIPKGSKNVDAACKWMKAMTSVDDVGRRGEERASTRARRRHRRTRASPPATRWPTTQVYKTSTVVRTPYFDEAVKKVLVVQRFSLRASRPRRRVPSSCRPGSTRSTASSRASRRRSRRSTRLRRKRRRHQGERSSNETYGTVAAVAAVSTAGAGPSREGPALGRRFPRARDLGRLRVPAARGSSASSSSRPGR